MRAAAPALLVLALALPQAADEPFEPEIAPASGEGLAAMERFELAPGLAVSLFAAEPMLANPVCFHVDTPGDAYVAETFRLHAGVTDMREHMDWLDRELANRTVEERVEMFRRAAGKRFEELYARAEERVRLVRDTDGDGQADEALVFADGFHDGADGIGAGLLSNGKDVYYTCMPSLWLLRDEDGDGRADSQSALSSGYGVHVALLGHDLHGLCIGPDEKLYFSCGDRGFRVETPQGVIDHTHAGAVLRCNLDGSELEVFATGLRNPQELAFDDAGNLFTGDNNSDGGDRARIVHVVEGAETGWRFAFQYLEQPLQRGPWNDERLWHPWHEGQAAYVLPPVANFADGPSGLAYNPFAGGDPRFAARFFLCDFRGTPSTSGIHCFELVPRGAGFELGEVSRPVWGTLVTDCEFGPEGDLWFSDWVEGWGQTGKGRIYRVKGLVDPAAGARSRALLARDFAGDSHTHLAELLDHPDQRVRLRAQFELAHRATRFDEPNRLESLARAGPLRVRRHAIWALGIAARCKSRPARDFAVVRLLEFLGDSEAEMRAQCARVLGDLRESVALKGLIRALQDEDPRVRMYAALGLGRIGDASAIEPLFALARETGSSDPVLRHAASWGLVGCAAPERLAEEAGDPSIHARLAAVVALRRLARPEVARFLRDPEPLVVVEAARAIHNVPIAQATGALAELLDDPRIGAGDFASNALVRRALAANRAQGGEEGARRLARFAQRAEAASEQRAEALRMLAEWSQPSGRDPVTGEWRPIAPRDAAFLPALVSEMAPAIASAPAPVADEWLRLVERYDVRALADELGLWLADADRASATRAAVFAVLSSFREPSFPTVVEAALRDPDGALRAAALEVLPSIGQTGALAHFRRVLEGGELAEQRAVFAALARMRDAEAQAILTEVMLERFLTGVLSEELALDFILAVEEGGDPPFRARLKTALDARRQLHGELAPWYDSAHGGDAERGRRIFREKAELSCLRCHPDGDAAGGGVGSDLRGVGRRLGRRQILEAIVLPNARIAPGFESFVLRLIDETVVAGRILGEDAETLRLLQADGVVLEIPFGDIELRRPDLSAMPEGLAQHLDRREMRDLVEYVSGM